jgi:hypothetical protein
MNWKVVDRIFVIISLILFGYGFYYSTTHHPYLPFYSEYQGAITGIILGLLTFPYFALRFILGAWKSKPDK